MVQSGFILKGLTETTTKDPVDFHIVLYHGERLTLINPFPFHLGTSYDGFSFVPTWQHAPYIHSVPWPGPLSASQTTGCDVERVIWGKRRDQCTLMLHKRQRGTTFMAYL